ADPPVDRVRAAVEQELGLGLPPEEPEGDAHARRRDQGLPRAAKLQPAMGKALGLGPAARAQGEAESFAHRWLQFGSAGETLIATARVGIPLWFLWREPEPELLLDGRPYPIDRWICGARNQQAWIGVAVVAVDSLAPGSYGLEMRFRRQPAWTGRLERL